MNRLRPVWADVHLGAIRRNAGRLRAMAAGAELCAVVKAEAYGHGAAPVARAALEGGATWLGVALVEEGAALRAAGIDAPVLVLSEPPLDAWDEVVAQRLTATVYSAAGVDAAAKAAGGPLPVHVKVDTGMHRVGASPEVAVELACAVDARPELVLDGVFTHFAVADELDADGVSFTDGQVAALRRTVATLVSRGVRPRLVHACNSAGVMTQPAACLDLVRCGISLYGLAPAPSLAARCADLEPAMTLRAEVSYVKQVAAGERASYGLRYRFDRPSWVATVPIGYADGLPRRLGAVGGEVLVGGRRRPIAGTVTMDQILVDCGDDRSVAVGDEVVLIGRQGGQAIGAWEWASLTDTIAYEIVCGISGRVPRVHR
jgi:alanine racemase